MYRRELIFLQKQKIQTVGHRKNFFFSYLILEIPFKNSEISEIDICAFQKMLNVSSSIPLKESTAFLQTPP